MVVTSRQRRLVQARIPISYRRRTGIEITRRRIAEQRRQREESKRAPPSPPRIVHRYRTPRVGPLTRRIRTPATRHLGRHAPRGVPPARDDDDDDDAPQLGAEEEEEEEQERERPVIVQLPETTTDLIFYQFDGQLIRGPYTDTNVWLNDPIIKGL